MARSPHEEEEEALSFCDLPVKQFVEEKPIIRAVQIDQDDDDDEEEGFDFKHWPAAAVAAPMCAAEEVFFQGHMLPLRLSFSNSENALSLSSNNNFGRNLWVRSESMDHNLLRFRNTSSSSRSSSTRSHYSRSSSISNNSVSIPTTSSKPRAQKNVFHSHPSPTPQIRSFSSSSHRSRSSSRWHFFRLGLLRTPGIMELHDLKSRTTTTTTAAHKATGSLLGVVSCKRSVDTVPPAPAKKTESGKAQVKMVKKLQKQKIMNSGSDKEKEKEKEKEGEERRMSHRRTFEWLKQLSHATFADEL